MLLPVVHGVGDSKENLFVLANEPDSDLNDSMHLPVLSILQFSKARNQFELRESKRFAPSIDLSESLLRLRVYQMQFLYLYKLANYVFVLKREKESWQPTKTRLGKLVIDPEDEQYSYVELPLSCTDPATGESFVYAESAHFGFGDSWMLKENGNDSLESDPGDTLFITFNSFNDSKVDASKGSLLCAFQQEILKKKFDETVERCREGDRSVRLMTRYSELNESTRCSRRKRRESSRTSSDDYLESLETVEGVLVYKLKDEVVTSLASTIHRRSSNETGNLFALGTATGKVYRLVRENEKLKPEIKFNPEVSPQSNSLTHAINANPLVKNDHVYFTGNHRLIKLSLSEKQCRGKRLEGKQIDMIGSAMGMFFVFLELI